MKFGEPKMDTISEKEKIDNAFSNIQELRAGIDVWQNNFHEFDVYTHSENCVKQLSNLTSDKNMLAAAWLHDIGKPVVAAEKTDKVGNPQEKEPGKPYHEFTDHEIVGEEMVRKMNPDIFNSLGLDQEKVAKLVGCHYIPTKGIKKLRTTTNFEQFINSFDDLNNTLSNLEVTKEEVLTIFLADKLAQGNGCTDQEELFLIRETLLKENQTNDDLRKIYEMQKQMYGNKE